MRDDADAGSGAARRDGTRTTGGVSWTDRVSRSRRASRTPRPSRRLRRRARRRAGRTLRHAHPGRRARPSTGTPVSCWPGPRDQPDRDPRPGRGRAGPRRRQPERDGGPARTRRGPLHRPRFRRRLPRPAARRRAARGPAPCSSRSPRRPAFLSVVATATGLADRSRPPRSGPRRWPRIRAPPGPLAGGHRAGRGTLGGPRRARLPAPRAGWLPRRVEARRTRRGAGGRGARHRTPSAAERSRSVDVRGTGSRRSPAGRRDPVGARRPIPRDPAARKRRPW